jgi:hypothetical protein
MGQAISKEHLEVAVVFLPLIDHVVEDPESRMAAIDDVVQRWRAVPSADQRRYGQEDTRSGFTPVMVFAEEFFVAMDHEATSELDGMVEGTITRDPEDGQLYEPLEAARINHWRDHLDRMGR